MAHRFSVPVISSPMPKDLANVWTPYGPPSRHILSEGWTKDGGRKPLPVDMIWEKDVKVPLRDGVHLLADVFRPVTSEETPVPAIMPWSPYGKTGTGLQNLDMLPFRVGVSRAATSGLEKWEAPDPADWIHRGYALVHIDARGTFMSEGDFAFYGTQEGRDGYDSIEWIAAQAWCNGAVAMAGNSWLGTTQWFIAAEQPPHLRCMAPWEGLGDFYRESIGRGGIPDHAFWDALMGFFGGQNKREDVAAMIDNHPLYNDYWDDKKPKLRNINVPMYATASYSTGLHTEGSVKGFLLSGSKDKWLRWSTTQEWHDLYQPQNVDDLQRFFDHYMLGANNGWETTPTVRLSLLGYNRPHVVDRPAACYPPPEFRYRKLYLDSSNCALGSRLPNTRSSQEYNAAEHRTEVDVGAHFDLTFDGYTELCGFSRIKLFMATPDHDDMDVYAVLRKVDVDGNVLYNFNIPLKDLPADFDPSGYPHMNTFKHTGPNGRLRASHRAITQEAVPGMNEGEYTRLMSDAYIWHQHDVEEKLQKDEIYELDFHLWPGGMVFEAGETLRLEVKGSSPIVEEFVGLGKSIVNHNAGRHVLYTGADCPSYLYVSLSD